MLLRNQQTNKQSNLNLSISFYNTVPAAKLRVTYAKNFRVPVSWQCKTIIQSIQLLDIFRLPTLQEFFKRDSCCFGQHAHCPTSLLSTIRLLTKNSHWVVATDGKWFVVISDDPTLIPHLCSVDIPVAFPSPFTSLLNFLRLQDFFQRLFILGHYVTVQSLKSGRECQFQYLCDCTGSY